MVSASVRFGLAAAAAVAVVVGIGWVARSTRAQDGKVPVLPTPAESSKLADVPTAGPAPAPVEVAPTSLPPPAPAPPPDDDPERNARDFIEQNRKVAQDELRKLKDEAERLRMRLSKVEAGIRRWEALVAALDGGDKTATASATPPPVGATPKTEEDAHSEFDRPRLEETKK